MKEMIESLRRAEAYNHSVVGVEVIETHLSWIFLTGKFAYKLKKPLKNSFVDFSNLQKRAFYCREEVRLNRQYTQNLYLGVVPVVRDEQGTIGVAEMPIANDASIVDWMVKMHQFDQACQGDHLVGAGAVGIVDFFDFGSRLALQHAAVESVAYPHGLNSAVDENFTTLKSVDGVLELQQQIERLQHSATQQLSEWSALLLERSLNGYVRECHGDLHLGNLMLHQGQLQAFDCLEFNQALREIDVWNDVAFLVMDCCVRNREDLAYGFVDGYLNSSGDYDGAILLSLYAQYRSMVRAKVAAIAYDQSGRTNVAAYDRLRLHLDWADNRSNRGPGMLLVCCGLSGSGKSFWSAQLAPRLGAIRLRSDVLRKTAAGISISESSNSGIGSGLYDPQHSDALYAELTKLCSCLLRQGENVIVDATCLTKAQRAYFLDAATEVGSKSVVLHLTAPDAVLRERIMQRQQQGNDASEADLSVLSWQQKRQELPGAQEPLLVADTSKIDIDQLVAQVEEFLRGTSTMTTPSTD